MKLSLFLATSLLLIASCASAQTAQDYYITTKLDTVYGDFGSNRDGRITFKVDGKKSKLDPQAIYRVYDAKRDALYAPSFIQNSIVKIAGSNPKMYRLDEQRAARSKPLFAQVLADGAIVVYSFVKTQTMGGSMMGPAPSMTSTHQSHRVYALKRSTKEIVEMRKTGTVVFFQVNATKLKNNQSTLFSDFPELVDEISKQQTVSFDYMIDCINRYNKKKEAEGKGLASYGVKIY